MLFPPNAYRSFKSKEVKKINSKQLLLDTLVKPVKADRRPVSLIGGGAWTLRQGGSSFREMAGKLVEDPAALSTIMVSLANKLGEGIVYVGAGYNNVIAALIRGVDLIYTADFSPYLPGFSSEETEKFIKECDSFDFKKIWEDPLLASFLAVAEQVKASLKESCVIAPLTWGPFTLAGQLIGVESLMRKMVKDPEAAKAVIDLSVNAVCEYYRPFVDKGLVDMVYLPEPTASGDMISARIFEKFAAPALNKCLEPYHRKELPTMVHICGKLPANQLAMLDNVENMDAVSIDCKVPLKDARDNLKNKCILGNLDTLRLERASETEIIGDLEKIMAEMEGHDRFILAPACDLAPATPFSHVKTLFDFVHLH